MDYLLFFIYLFLLCWLLTKIKFIRQSNIGSRVIIILFLLRVLAGVVNGWLNLNYFAISDSVVFHIEGIKEYHLMLSNPKEYLINVFTSGSSYGAIFDITDSFWNNLRSNLIIKLLSLFNILSNCNYFINALFYNFFIFFGSVSLYRVFIKIFGERKNMLIITVFLLPSFLYFTSGIHRDGLIFLAIAFVCYSMWGILKNGISVKRILCIFFSLLLIFLLRNFVFITILPALTGWIIAEKKQKSALLVFIVSYLIFVLIFFSLKFIHPKLDLPQYVSARQIAFIDLEKISASAIDINPLSPNLKSFFINTPQALNHSLMRPYLWENKNFLYIPSAIEIFIYEILLLAYIFFTLKKYEYNGFIYFGIFFTLSMYLLIGYTIPILGAIIRYRSIYLPLIITPVACLIDLAKIKLKLYGIKN